MGQHAPGSWLSALGLKPSNLPKIDSIIHHWQPPSAREEGREEARKRASEKEGEVESSLCPDNLVAGSWGFSPTAQQQVHVIFMAGNATRWPIKKYVC